MNYEKKTGNLNREIREIHEREAECFDRIHWIRNESMNFEV
jgi:hypothetical protein